MGVCASDSTMCVCCVWEPRQLTLTLGLLLSWMLGLREEQMGVSELKCTGRVLGEMQAF